MPRPYENHLWFITTHPLPAKPISLLITITYATKVCLYCPSIQTLHVGSSSTNVFKVTWNELLLFVSPLLIVNLRCVSRALSLDRSVSSLLPSTFFFIMLCFLYCCCCCWLLLLQLLLFNHHPFLRDSWCHVPACPFGLHDDGDDDDATRLIMWNDNLFIHSIKLFLLCFFFAVFRSGRAWWVSGVCAVQKNKLGTVSKASQLYIRLWSWFSALEHISSRLMALDRHQGLIFNTLPISSRWSVQFFQQCPWATIRLVAVKSAHHEMTFTTLVPLFLRPDVLCGGVVVVAGWLTSFKAGLGIVVSWSCISLGFIGYDFHSTILDFDSRVFFNPFGVLCWLTWSFS